MTENNESNCRQALEPAVVKMELPLIVNTATTTTKKNCSQKNAALKQNNKADAGSNS